MSSLLYFFVSFRHILGAVGVGRQRLTKQAILQQSMSDLLASRE